MSGNLDLVRSIVTPMERGDFSGWVDSLAHPEIECVITDGPEPASLNGVSAYLEWTRDFLSAWEGYRLKADAYRELDDERVVVLVHASGGRGKTSGVELGQHGGGGALLFHIRDREVIEYIVYFDRQHALSELGLTSEGGSQR
jgi:ketosteroid isomerase-like protein